INGRKRHLIVDSLGFLLSVLVTAANLDEGTHAPQVLAKLTSDQTSRLEEIRGDSKYNNRTLDRYLETSQADYKVTVVERLADAKGLVLLPLSLSGGADECVDWKISSQQQGLRTNHPIGRSHGAGEPDSLDAQTARTRPRYPPGGIPISSNIYEKSSMTFRIDS
ncbi:MAG TPA: transposase, partial [Planctomicrobium sp.]|nr:transposase [Planctomicrobium sp.]